MPIIQVKDLVFGHKFWFSANENLGMGKITNVLLDVFQFQFYKL